MWNIHYHQKGIEMWLSRFTRVMLAITIGWVLAGCTIRILTFGNETSNTDRDASLGYSKEINNDTK